LHGTETAAGLANWRVTSEAKSRSSILIQVLDALLTRVFWQRDGVVSHVRADLIASAGFEL